jgi:alkylation response protein AidB-like acyl-CoA dehydrogenase
VFNPSGSITAVDGGYRVSGRWSFASGCEHASWLWGNCIEGIVDGAPQMRIAVFARNEVEIEDTWDVIGLSGTGSHHFRATNVLVPADRTFIPFASEPCLDDPIARVPAPALYSHAIASVALGIAQGALDDIVSLSAVKVPLLAHGTLATNELFHHELATADTELRAARALLHQSAVAAWEAAVAEAAPTQNLRARGRAAAAWVVDRAVAVVGTAYRHGGGSSVYATSPLQRRLRDINALSQHFLVRPDTLTTAGAVFAGNELTAPVF